VKLAVPFSVGDNFHGFRIVGTTDAFFSKNSNLNRGKSPRVGRGRVFNLSEPR